MNAFGKLDQQNITTDLTTTAATDLPIDLLQAFSTHQSNHVWNIGQQFQPDLQSQLLRTTLTNLLQKTSLQSTTTVGQRPVEIAAEQCKETDQELSSRETIVLSQSTTLTRKRKASKRQCDRETSVVAEPSKPDEKRRLTKNIREKRRREAMNEEIYKLATLLDLPNDPPVEKLNILRHTVRLLQGLRSEKLITCVHCAGDQNYDSVGNV